MGLKRAIEWVTATCGTGKGTQIKLDKQIEFRRDVAEEQCRTWAVVQQSA